MSSDDRPGRAAHALIFLTVALDALALGLLTPVLPSLLKSLSGADAAGTAGYFGVFATLFAAMQFFAAPIQGALSDRFGRRPILLASNFALGLDYLIMAFAPSIWLLFIGRTISGIASGSGAAAYAYVADVTDPERRAERFGWLSGAGAIGLVLGPTLGGLVGSFGLRWPFWIAAALSLTNGALCLFLLPESLKPGNRAGFDWRQTNPFSALVWLVRGHRGLLGLVAAGVVMSLASQGANGVAVLYTGFRYAWSVLHIGLALGAVSVIGLITVIFLVGPATRRFGERSVLLGGLAITTLGLLVGGLAPSGLLFTASIVAVGVGAICGPVYGGMLSGRVGADEQGRLQGAWASINAIMGLAAPALFTSLFAAAVRPGMDVALSGAPMVLGAAMLLGAIGLAWGASRPPTAPAAVAAS